VILAAFKDKSRILRVLTFDHYDLNRAREVHLMQTQFCWISDSKTYQPNKLRLSIAKFSMNTRVVVYKLVKQLRLIIVAD
jgi:hypothetical protein